MADPLYARLLRGGLEAWIGLLHGLGARGPSWEWKKQTWRRRLEDRLAGWRNLERGVRARTRMCPACRYLAPLGQATCPSCGASMRGVPGGGWSRLAAMILPGGVGTMTVVLITANVAMAIVALGLSGGQAAVPSGANPLRLLAPSWEVLYHLGAKFGGDPRYPGIFDGQIWRLVTAGYLHGGLLHLLFNCYALSSLGPLIEDSFGGRRLFVLYTTTGIVAFSFSTLLSSRPSVGASGSLFGLMGFAFFFGRFRGGSVGRAIADQLLRWIILGAVMILLPGIDNAAHIGGFACGAALAFVLDPGEPRTPVAVIGLRLSTAAAWLVTLGSFVAMGLSYRALSAAIQ
jgi:rhomboid protease GluP